MNVRDQALQLLEGEEQAIDLAAIDDLVLVIARQIDEVRNEICQSERMRKPHDRTIP